MICQLDGSVMTPTDLPDGIQYACPFCKGEEYEPRDVSRMLQREWGGAE